MSKNWKYEDTDDETKKNTLFQIGPGKEKDDIHSTYYKQFEESFDETTKFDINNLYHINFLENEDNSVPVNLTDINRIDIENEDTFYRVPHLAHDLDQIVKNPGIYPMEEIAKIQADGGKFLQNIMTPEEIDMDRIPPYIPPSQDSLLLKFAKESKIKYVMSTSTISSAMSQVYYQFANFKLPDFRQISSRYENEPKKYMISQRKPVTNFIRKIDKENNIYAFDSDPGVFHTKNSILMDLGKIMEKQLCLTPEEFNQHLVKGKIDESIEALDDDHHRFMKLNNNICLRSQIDATTKLEDGTTPVFEIKTRSVCPIRYDVENYKDYLDYEIKNFRGIHSSYEREYYDLIRGAMLKYAFQQKIGRMDGAFIAYHNTQQIFGFEYVKTTEIERRIFGSTRYADLAFMCCSKLLTCLFDEVLKALSQEDYSLLKLGIYADGSRKSITVFAEQFDEIESWDKNLMVQMSDSCQNEYDYYTKVWKKPIKVHKFEYNIFTYVNGILQKNSKFNWQEGDQVNLRYSFQYHGKANFDDYMDFLNQAYYYDSYTIDFKYSGMWLGY